MKTHERISISFNAKKGDGSTYRKTIRMNTVIEEEHKEIYGKKEFPLKIFQRKSPFILFSVVTIKLI